MEKKYDFKETGFESYVNKDAEVIIVGVTPGNNQLGFYQNYRLSPLEIKRKYAFNGEPMRSNLINMLNHIGVNRLLGIQSCETLWENDFHLVEMTSLLKRATFVKANGKMFNKAEKIIGNPELKEEFNKGFVKDCKLYNKAILFVACGPGVYNVLMELFKKGVIKNSIIGIAHPSGQNGNWVNCYLNKKEANSDTLRKCENMRDDALAQLQSLINMRIHHSPIKVD